MGKHVSKNKYRQKLGGLTPRQDRFAREYAATGNGTQAAIDAGYTKHPAAARSQAWENLQRQSIAERVEYYIQNIGALTKPDAILGRMLSRRDKCDELERFSDANKIDELLGKYSRLWNENSVNLTGDVTFNVLVPDKRPELACNERSDQDRAQGKGQIIDADTASDEET